MAQPLPGESVRPRLLEVLLAIVAVLGLGAVGCGTSTVRARRLAASVFQSGRGAPAAKGRSKARTKAGTGKPGATGARRGAEPRGEGRPGHEGATFGAAALRRSGLRFGTDGTTGALWGYLSQSHAVISPGAARPGDVLFFDTRARTDGPSCADHAAIVERIEPDGRIVFAEVRSGTLRESLLDPAQPTRRRNAEGAVANSFLRVKAIDDPPDARYLAGELLCGVVRVTPTK